MIPYMVGKLAPNPTHSTRGLVKYVSGRGYFRAVPSQNGENNVTYPPPLNRGITTTILGMNEACDVGSNLGISLSFAVRTNIFGQ